MTGPVIFRDGRDRATGLLPIRRRLRAVPDYLSAWALDRNAVPVWLRRVTPDGSGCSHWPGFAVGDWLSLDEAADLAVAGEA